MENKNVFIPSNMRLASKNIIMYTKEQMLLIEEFKEIFSNLSNYYRTSNNLKINSLTDNIVNEMKIIKKIFENYTILFKKVESKYEKTNDSINEIFKKIDIDVN